MSDTIQHSYALMASVILDPVALATLPPKDGPIVEVSVDTGIGLVRVQLDAVDLARAFASCARRWPEELAVVAEGELRRGLVLTRTNLTIGAPATGRIRPH